MHRSHWAAPIAIVFWLGLAMPLRTGQAAAAERLFVEATLKQALSSGGDLVLLLGVEDGNVTQHAVRVAGEPYTACRMKEHGLKVHDGRLSGPAEIEVGMGSENISLDAALDKGGNFSAAYGCPEPPRKAEGEVIVEPWKAPPSAKQSQELKQSNPQGNGKEPSRTQWMLWLPQALGPDTQLGLLLEVDRQAKSVTALPAMAPGYNRSRHPVDASNLRFDGANLEGEVGITIVPGRRAKWLAEMVPAHGQPIAGSIKVRASLEGKDQPGRYSAVFGIERRRQGLVSIKPATEAEMLAFAAPVISPRTPWRVWLAAGPRITRTQDNQIAVGGRSGKPAKPPTYDAENAQLSPLPPADWKAGRFDDSLWGRCMADLFELMGGYGALCGASEPALLCLRTRFGVSDPARAGGMKVTIEYLGGAAVYVNGVEVGRAHLPDGELEPHTPAADYPIAAYTEDDGATPLPGLAVGAQPEATSLPRYQARVRTTTLSVPARVLTKGSNVLAIEVHRTPTCGPAGPRNSWSHLAIREVTLTSNQGAGLVPFAEALKGTRVWSAQPCEQVADEPFPRSRIAGGWSNWSREVYGVRGTAVTGVNMGNPFDPVLPVRILAPRNGVAHGQAVLSDPDGLRGVGAAVSDLQGPRGAVLPARSVRVRFGVQGPDFHWCDELREGPPERARSVPVWLRVHVPADQAPGWYVSELSLEANGRTFRVPVQVFVTAFAVPDAKDLRSLMGVMHSPDALADAYQVEPWSEAHFRLMAKSLEMAGQLGNDVLYVPIIIGTHMGHETGLIRWVKTDNGLQPDFSLFKRYLDLYGQHAAPPKAISLYMWSPETAFHGREITDVWSGPRVAARTGTSGRPLEVTLRDPKTGATENVGAPGFLAEGAEAFWKPMLDGVHKIVLERGWSERVIMVGCAGDTRPAPKTGEVLRQWAPYMRWDIYSHFVGDPGVGGGTAGVSGMPPPPGAAPGKLIALGDLEVGLKEHPGGDEGVWLANLDFLDMPLQRASFYDQSPPLAFRTLPMLSGRLARVGLDFWPENVRYSPLIWGIYPIRLAVRGPDGPQPTVRLAMMREALQDFEARLVILEALPKLPAPEQASYRALLGDLRRRFAAGNVYLSQAELGLDWPGYAAELYRAAEELSGSAAAARWEAPPQ